MDWQAISDGEINPGQPGTSSLFYRLRDNPGAISGNDPDVPTAYQANNVPLTAYYNAPGGFAFNVPTNVHRLRITLQGAGGGGGGIHTGGGAEAGVTGGASSVTVGATTYTANGGAGGYLAEEPAATTVNIPFLAGMSLQGNAVRSTVIDASGGQSMFGAGGLSPAGDGRGHGDGGGGAIVDGLGERFGGCGGAYAQFVVAVEPGSIIAITVGSGGDGGGEVAFQGGDGADGLVIIEY